MRSPLRASRRGTLRANEARAALDAGQRRARGTCVDPGVERGGRAAAHALDAPVARSSKARGRSTGAARRSGGAVRVASARRRRVQACHARQPARRSRWCRVPCSSLLARALGQAWPGDVTRDALVARAFRAQGGRRVVSCPIARGDRAPSRCAAPLASINATKKRLRAGPAPRARGRRARASG